MIRRACGLLALAVLAAAALAAFPRTAEAVCTVNAATSTEVNFRASTITSSSITFSWNRPSCASGAVSWRVTGATLTGGGNCCSHVYADGGTISSSTASALGWTKTGLNANTTYHWRVRIDQPVSERSDFFPHNARLSVTTKQASPGTPGGVTVTPGVGQLAVSWTAATNAGGYKVQWKSGSQAYDAARQATVGSGTSHTITSLTAGTVYTVRVIATRTNADDGPASAEQTGTPKYSPPGAPGGVTVTPGAGQLAVSWTAATDAGGYKVQWKSGAQAYDAARQATVGSGTSHTITNLTAGTVYTVRVIATRSNADDGPASAERTGTPKAAPPGTPGGVTVTPGVGQLAVSWTAAANAGGYKVQWKSGAQAYDAARQATVGSGTSHTITGLTAGTAYTVRVIATRTNADDGPASAERTGTPKQSPPGAPGGVTVTPGMGQLAVSWTVAANADGYKVQWKSGAQAYDAARQATVGSGTSHTITGLSAGTEYTVRVVATRSNADDGPATAERTGTPRAAPPGAPGGVTVTPGAGRLAVSWTAVTGADGYKVQWKSGAQTYDAARQATVGSGTSHTITGLAAGTEYTVRVIATRTDADDGPASAERTGTPKQSPPGAPGDVTVTPEVGRLAVSWTAAANADGYKVQWKSGAQAYEAARQATVGSGTSHAITGLSAGTEYTVRVVATRTDADDGPASAERTGTPTTGRIDLSAPTLAVTAGGAGETYTVVLGAAPDGDVTVAIASDNGDVTASPDSLSFTASDWSAPQTVTATAAADEDGYADAASLTHTASGGGYDGVTGTLPVAVAGDSRVKVSGAGETVYRIRGRTVTVAAMPGAPADIEIDLADLPAAPSGEALTLTFAPVASPAASDAFAFGPPEARTVVDVTVTAGRVPSAGLRLCLPVAEAMREAARARPLLLLRYDGDAWGAVAGSAASAAGSLVCADGVSSFSPFAVGYADTAPSFAADAALAALAFTAGETIEPVTLPAATGGDGTSYELGPRPLALPPGLRFDPDTRVLSGTPTEAFAQRRYTWTATDIDGESDALSFTMEVLPALAAARERLRAVNESVLPELSRAMWGSVIDALTGRLESAGLSVGDGAGVMASGLAGASEFLRSHEGALEAGPGSWRELLAGESFVLGVGSGAGGPGGAGSPVTVWGSGDWRKLSLDDDALDWSGELFSAHVGVDARLGGRVRGGVAASWFEGGIDYTDRSGEAAVSGVHESRLPAVHPYAGWFGADGSRLWGALGYGEGEVEIADADLAERFGGQKSDSAFLAAAAGGSVPVASSAGGFALALKGSGEATRYSVEDNGAAIAAVSVDTQRLRLSATGSRRWVLAGGGTLTPSLETGARWDGGDGETGAGVELGGGVEWTLPSRGLSVAARGRTLAAHAGAAEEWGVSGSARLSPPGGRGLSLALSPRWGASESGLSRLWDEGVAGRGSPVGGSDAGAARLEAELGYGFREGGGLLTPSAGFGYGNGGARRWRVGTRFDLGPALAVSVATERRDGAADAGHALRIDLRMSW